MNCKQSMRFNGWICPRPVIRFRHFFQPEAPRGREDGEVIVTLGDFLQATGIPTILGGSVAAILTHLLTRQKRGEELRKLRLENEKLENENKKLSYRLPDSFQPNETILYSIDKSDGHDFHWVNVEHADGDLEVKKGILNIRRKNKVGTLQVWLDSYTYLGQASLSKLPKNENISGDRRLRMFCEVKAIGGEHTLLFLFKGESDPLGVHLAERRERVKSNEWTPVEAHFRISPAKNCQFRIDDRSVSAAGSSVQIRKLVLAERVTSASEADILASSR